MADATCVNGEETESSPLLGGMQWGSNIKDFRKNVSSARIASCQANSGMCAGGRQVPAKRKTGTSLDVFLAARSDATPKALPN